MEPTGPPSDPGTLTQLLGQARSGDRASEDQLLALVHKELKLLALQKMAAERANHTLQPTALVNEAFLRMFRGDSQRQPISGRKHFFALASTVMRQILVDHARSKHAAKRGGDFRRVELDESTLSTERCLVDVLALDTAMTKLAAISSRAARLVELCFFAGLTIEDAAEVLEVSSRTLKRDWNLARAWLHKEIYGVPRE